MAHNIPFVCNRTLPNIYLHQRKYPNKLILSFTVIVVTGVTGTNS